MCAFLCGISKWGYSMKNDDIKSIYHSGKTHANFNVEFKGIVSKDETLCMYDYADIILGGFNNVTGKFYVPKK